MSNEVSLFNRRWRFLLEPKWLLLVYALFDLVLTWIRVQHLVVEATAAEINLIETPLAMMADSFLLLVAAVGLRLSKPWSYLAAITASGWLFYNGVHELWLIASAVNVPMWSSAALSYWWAYGSAAWDFPRLVANAVVLLYATLSLCRYPKSNERLKRSDLHSSN